MRSRAPGMRCYIEPRLRVWGLYCSLRGSLVLTLCYTALIVVGAILGIVFAQATGIGYGDEEIERQPAALGRRAPEPCPLTHREDSRVGLATKRCAVFRLADFVHGKTGPTLVVGGQRRQTCDMVAPENVAGSSV